MLDDTTPIQLVVIAYLILIFITFFLLNLPIFYQKNAKPSWLDTFFLAVSSVSVTGLTTVPLQQVLNHWGIILLEFIFQVGGFGVTMLTTVMMILSGKKISLHQRQMIQVDMNQPRLSGTVRLSYSIFILMVVLQLVFGVIFSLYFSWQQNWEHLKSAFFNGFYISVTAVTNAGFDITGSSLAPYEHNHLFLLIVMLLIIIGGIGFPVLVEGHQWLMFKLHDHGGTEFFAFLYF
ncbi:potassium transporter TrkG, partial [Liquorilactobacillus vini]|uniref:potassium transporter TrkG n=1 Tax=Liquorilactobacillus vini TaxID=238015 RepID=UPI002E1ABD49